MKKTLALGFALALALALAACGAKGAVQDAVRDMLDDSGAAGATSGAESGATPAPQPPAGSSPAASAGGGGAAMESLLDWMAGGTFSYDYTMRSEYEGAVTESAGSVAVAGDSFAMTSESTSGGVTSKARVMVLEGVTYIIDDASRLIMKMSGGGLSMTGGIPIDYGDMVPVGGGTGEVNGRTLPYEEYTVDGVSAKYYMDGGAVYAIESTYEGAYSLMVITGAMGAVPPGAFDLPKGYAELGI